MFQSGVCACFRKTALFGSVWIWCFLYQVQLYWIRFSSFLRSQGRIGPKCWTSLPWKHQMRKYLLVIMIHNKPEFPFCFLWGQGMLATKLICTQCCPKENCLYGFSKQTNTFISIQTTQKKAAVQFLWAHWSQKCAVLCYSYSHFPFVIPVLCPCTQNCVQQLNCFSYHWNRPIQIWKEKKNEDAAEIQRSGAE